MYVCIYSCTCMYICKRLFASDMCFPVQFMSRVCLRRIIVITVMRIRVNNRNCEIYLSYHTHNVCRIYTWRMIWNASHYVIVNLEWKFSIIFLNEYLIITVSSITERRSKESREKIVLMFTYNYFNVDYYLPIIICPI